MLVRSAFVIACAVAVAFGANVDAASAQPAPAASASAVPAKPVATPVATAAPTPTATPYKLITFTGSSIDAGITTVLGSDKARFVNGNPARVFDAGNGPFFDSNSGKQLAPANDFVNVPTLQDAIINLNLNGPFIGGRIEYGFGVDADVVASNGQNRSGNSLIQGYLQAAKGPFTLLVGKFSTLSGTEVIESANNANYSRSFQFGSAIPFTHTGVRLTYAYNPKISVIVGVNNGWDDVKFVGKKKTIEAGLSLNPSPGYSIALTTYNGSDFAVTGNPAIFSNRMLYDAALTVHPTSALTLVGGYDNGTQLANLSDPNNQFQTARYNAISGIATYQVNPLIGVSLRKESFHDTNGFRSGIVQRVQSSTATMNYTPNSTFIVRGEYRIDKSDVNAYQFRNDIGGIGRNFQPTFGLETVVKFP